MSFKVRYNEWYEVEFEKKADADSFAESVNGEVTDTDAAPEQSDVSPTVDEGAPVAPENVAVSTDESAPLATA